MDCSAKIQLIWAYETNSKNKTIYNNTLIFILIPMYYMTHFVNLFFKI